jgi:ankyrin repeat protein
LCDDLQAVIEGNLQMVRFLLGKSANINAQDNEGWTPLHAAACCNKPDIVQFLCENGADLTITNGDKDLPIDLAETDELKHTFELEYAKKSL